MDLEVGWWASLSDGPAQHRLRRTTLFDSRITLCGVTRVDDWALTEPDEDRSCYLCLLLMAPVH